MIDKDTDQVIGDDEMVVLTMDDLSPEVSPEEALARGDVMPEGTPESLPEVTLDEETPAGQEDDSLDESEDDAEAEGEDEEGETAGGPMIPLSRMAAKVAQNRELEKRLAALEEENRTLREKRPQAAEKESVEESSGKDDGQQQFDLRTKYREYADMVADGDTDGAAVVMAEIDAYKDQVAEQRMTKVIEDRELRNAEQSRKHAWEQDLPAAQAKANDLVEAHGEYFADPVNQASFTAVRDHFIAAGNPLSKALDLAAERLFTAAKNDSTDLVTTRKAEQKKAAVARNAAAARQQPPRSQGGRGVGDVPEIPPNALTVSDQEFGGMSEKDKRAARGDFI
ncbi:MAG: hypothetical protein ACK5PS_08915 [Desulfopila sp.]